MPAEPTTPKGRRTREHLVSAGRTVFARDGYVNARMGDVAQEASVSMGGLYRYFKNKEDLFAQVIEDLHEQLFEASASREHSFREDPYESLLASNRGYLEIYAENSDVMRAFIQAAHVEKRFQDIWWHMRNRHIERFAGALARAHGITEIDGVDARLYVESMACMAEQSAYVWFAQGGLRGGNVSINDAARSITHSWYTTFFADLSLRPSTTGPSLNAGA